MVAAAPILERMARRRREARPAVIQPEVSEVHFVPLVDGVTPAVAEAAEWESWGEEVRCIFLERMGVGTDSGMTEEDSLHWALAEARMAHAGIRPEDRPRLGRALVLFEGHIVSVEEPRSER